MIYDGKTDQSFANISLNDGKSVVKDQNRVAELS